MKTIEIVSGLTATTFEEQFYNKKPFLDTIWAAENKACESWTSELLLRAIGNKMVKVNFSETGVYNYTVKGQTTIIEGSFSEMMHYFTDDKYNNRSYYLQQTSIHENFPELVDNLVIPELISENDLLKEVNLWVGGKGCLTPLHFDQSQNFLLQVQGTKSLILYAPEDTPYLYPRTDKDYHVSQVNLEQIDHEKFPLFSKAANRYHVLLKPGHMLYLPPGWWHQVLSLDMSVSINYWFHKFDVIKGAGMEYVPVEHLCQIFSLFVGKGASIDYIGSDGELLLIKAVSLEYANFVEAFLKMGANPNAISLMYMPGLSALDIAIKNNSTLIKSLLLDYGAHKQ